MTTVTTTQASHPRLDAAVPRLLAAALLFGTLSALVGGVMGAIFDGAGVPASHLDGSAFSSYLIPGLILGVVIGGTHGIAAAMVLRRHRRRLLAAAIAGFGMIIWIFTELAVLTAYSWLQTAYLVLGIGEVALVLVLLGVLRPAAWASRP